MLCLIRPSDFLLYSIWRPRKLQWTTLLILDHSNRNSIPSITITHSCPVIEVEAWTSRSPIFMHLISIFRLLWQIFTVKNWQPAHTYKYVLPAPFIWSINQKNNILISEVKTFYITEMVFCGNHGENHPIFIF